MGLGEGISDRGYFAEIVSNASSRNERYCRDRIKRKRSKAVDSEG